MSARSLQGNYQRKRKGRGKAVALVHTCCLPWWLYGALVATAGMRCDDPRRRRAAASVRVPYCTIIANKHAATSAIAAAARQRLACRVFVDEGGTENLAGPVALLYRNVLYIASTRTVRMGLR